MPWVLLVLAFLTYGLLFWARGFYWDEAPWTWIYFRLGPEALTRTFSTSRPFWGLIYQVTLPLIGPYPWRWQLAMVLMRWLSALLVWAVLRRTWPPHPQLALWTSMLFLVYPGLSQNFIALMYTHFYIVLDCFLFSLYLSILAVKNPAWRVPLTAAALLFSAVNLLTMEYFYFLEALRVVVLWIVLDGSRTQRLLRSGVRYVPYLILFLGVSIWRAFFFKNQTASYSYASFDLLRQSPWEGLRATVENVLSSFWETVPHTWLLPFSPVDISGLGPRTTAIALGLAFASVLLAGTYLFAVPRPAQANRQWTRPALLLGISAWMFAGGSLWLAGIQAQPHFPVDRFTLPFMLGSSLLMAAVVSLLWAWPRIQYTAIALLVGFSVAWQFEANVNYVRDWETERTFFWQLAWRIPDLESGTTVLTSDLPVKYFSDNSLSGPLNWIYSAPGRMDHILFFASVRSTRALPELRPGLPFEQNYLATVFHGNTSRLVTVDFSPPGCLRVLDPEIDWRNRLLPQLLRESAVLSSSSMIRAGTEPILPPALYGPEPSHGWCYYFERADLAAQFEDWASVVALGDKAFSLDDHPNDPVERFVFVEAYARTGDWPRAVELSAASYRVSKAYVGPPLCALWSRIEDGTPDSGQKAAAVMEGKRMFACTGE